MKKILVFITLLIIPTIIMAEECSNTELVELKKKASKIEFKLVPDYVISIIKNADNGEEIEKQRNVFWVYAGNLSDDFDYIIQTDENMAIEWDSIYAPPEKGTFKFLVRGDYSQILTEKLNVYSKKCDGKYITTYSLTVPKRNEYYDMQICDGISDYYLCQEFVYENYQVGFNDVKKSVEKYRDGKVDENGKKKEDKSFMDMIASFTSKYFVPLIIVLVVAVGIIVYINVKRHNRMKKHFN